MSCSCQARLSRGYGESEDWSGGASGGLPCRPTIHHPTSNINAIVRANLLPGTCDALHPPWRGVLGSRHPCTLPQRPFCWNTLAAHPVIPSTSFTSQPAPKTSEFTSEPNQHRLATPISHGMDLHVQPRRCFVEPFGRRCIKTSLAALQKGPSGSRVLEGDSRCVTRGAFLYRDCPAESIYHMAQDRQAQDSVQAANPAAAVQRGPGLVVGTVRETPPKKNLSQNPENVSKQRGKHGGFFV